MSKAYLNYLQSTIELPNNHQGTVNNIKYLLNKFDYNKKITII